MPVSLENSKVVYDALKGCGVRLMSSLPETWLVHLIRMAEEDPEPPAALWRGRFNT